MYILIVGGGKVGTYLARGLIKQQHEVIVIEKDARKAQLMTNLLESDVAVVGDGCDPNVLLQAGLARADVVVADTGDDEDNLVVCIITKKHSKAKCIARVNNPKNKLIFESLDSDRPVVVISSTELILDMIDERVNATDLEPLAKVGRGGLELVQLRIADNSPARGKRIADVILPRGSVIVAVDRGGGDVVVANGDTTLQRGDDVIAMIKRETRGDLCAALVG
ncbi:MAG: trk/ktr system potassium uptake protein [Candidatus Eremiobacteraeota bacterium]|jgi:trk system potassium uptake protein TrkA|nr:trk/ktr system potassium uptake protein [Candidatus Eremiobacteraeota bacterium]